MNVKPKMFPFLAVIHRHVRNPSENLGLNSLKVNTTGELLKYIYGSLILNIWLWQFCVFANIQKSKD